MAAGRSDRLTMFSEQLLCEQPNQDEPVRKRQRKGKRAEHKEEEELIAFGYEARIFDDKNTATKVEQGHYLLPWQSDDANNKMMLDRFDVRHLLESIPPRIPHRDFPKEPYPDIDEERYADLDSDEGSLFDMSEDERDARVDEKRRKKQQQEEASNAFKYDYEGNSQSDIQRKLAAQYKTAADMPLPDTQEQADTIVSTAKAAAASVNPKLFEIKTQARQGNNPLYAFLSQRHPLYRFYKHIIWLSSSGLGAYGDSSSSDDDDDDDNEKDDQPTRPPDDIAGVIQKTAQSVARAGKALEARIRQGHGQNPKFGFIHQGHQYHAYYKKQLESFQKST
ncbi:hypothetical protein O0I10_012747 [Lichtheimia ornata]|uniref:SURP motif domain-containing protein n=1 Tax=Lichtheimia ornata TaxID=688661 RepID=A0AAD7XPB8_9FUNG|nr:uncharacterized protein O0I10_012747 [Lichtheimia ornata]KAJ8651679.1 hypothetical protein O0I10_012747 [Lichtheimia ornata]